MTVKFTRTNLSLLFILLTALSPETLQAGVGTWTNSGPDGGSVFTIASHPSNPSIVYAATTQGLYRSVDAGGFWTLLLSGAFGHVIPTSDPSIVYATSRFGGPIFRTTDGAQTWTEFGTAGPIYAVTVEPDDPRTLYAITVQGLLRSADGAFTWERLPNPVGATFGAGIAVDPGDSRFLYAFVVTGQGFAVHRSSDRGATWSPTSLREAIRTFLFDPRDPSRLFAATNAGLYVTTDRGGSWRRLGAQRDFTHLAIDPADSGRLYAISVGAVYRSSNGGETMTRVSADLGQAVSTIAASANVVLAGSEIGAYRSDDGGEDWRAASRGIREISVRSLAIDPSDPSVVFAATSSGIFESRDGAASWRGLLTRLPSETVAIDPTDRSTLYAAGQGGVSKSTDGGRSWHNNGRMAEYLTELLIDPNNPRRILAGFRSVHRSRDGGENWDPVLTPEDDYVAYYYPPTVTSMEFAPSDRAVVYASASDSSRSVYRSRDSGETWTALDAHLPGASALAVDSCDPAIVHAGAWSGGYRTFDGGETWTQSSQLPPVFALARDPRHPSSVFAGTAAGLFWTNDRGATWTRFEPALTGPVRALALDPSGRFLHAVTDPGGLPLGGVAGPGVFSLERTFDPCTKAADRLCLVGGKYQVSVTARHPRTGGLVTGRAIDEGDRFGYFSFPDVTGDAGFPEVFVKMVDAMAAPPPYGGHAWVFHSSLTDLDYTLTVLETETGRARTYVASDTFSLTCGWSDTSAFVKGCADDGPAASTAPGARLAAPSGAELTLLNGRFRASVRATDPRTGRIAEGAALSRADGFGYFSLPAFTGDPSFPEVFVKMTDATGLPGGGFWVFHTGLTDVGYTLTVTDSATGAVKTYRRDAPNGPGLCGQADTSAFRN